MTDVRRTRFNTEMTNRGLSLTAAQSHHDLKEIISVAESVGGTIQRTADGTHDTWVLGPAAGPTNTLTIVSVPSGPGVATGVTTVQVADAGGDTLACTYTAGAVLISLANTTDSKNTLTLIKAALDLLNTSTNGAVLACYITNTASTQMVHGGTNTLAATAAGGTAGTSLVSSTAGTLGTFTVLPA